MQKIDKEIRQGDTSIENMDNIASKVLDTLGKLAIPIPIVAIAQEMGFQLYKQDLKPEMSGYVIINDTLRDKFNTDRVIIVNEDDNAGHKRFTIAHELAHYIFDFDDEAGKAYYNTYMTTEKDDKKEKRANRFAASLMMPKNTFIDEYNVVKDIAGNKVAMLADYFKVSATAVEKRMEELNLG